jgi:hypothetical protein
MPENTILKPKEVEIGGNRPSHDYILTSLGVFLLLAL